jgi:hypothetical protein
MSLRAWFWSVLFSIVIWGVIFVSCMAFGQPVIPYSRFLTKYQIEACSHLFSQETVVKPEKTVPCSEIKDLWVTYCAK